MLNLKRWVVKYLREIADKIEADSCEMTDEEAMRVMSIIAHEPLSKEQAANYMNLSTSRFDDYVRMRKLPRGRKRRGHRELDWYKDELDMYKSTIKERSVWQQKRRQQEDQSH